MGARLCPEGVCLAWCVKCFSRKFLVLRKHSVIILIFYLDCTESWGDWESTLLSVSEGTLGKSFGGTFAVPEGGASSAGLMSMLTKDPVLLDEGKLAKRP